MAIAYAWMSQKGVSYFVSTRGSTEPSPIKYQSKFEDEWGNTIVWEIDRPEVAHFLYEYLPLIDEHNKQRQSLLGLERRCQTKDPWFRLLCTLMGMSIVGMHCCYRHEAITWRGKAPNVVNNMRIQKFTDLICGSLRKWSYKLSQCEAAQSSVHGETRNPPNLVRITGTDGSITKEPTEKNAKRGKTIGNPHCRMCIIC